MLDLQAEARAEKDKAKTWEDRGQDCAKRLLIAENDLAAALQKLFALEAKESIRREQARVRKARHMLVYILRQHYALRYSEIGRRLGRDHSTAINSYQRMSEFLEYDKGVQKIYNTVKELLGICN